MKILLIEHNAADVRSFKELLNEAARGYCDITVAKRLSSALKKLGAEPFDIVVLELSLPDSQGLDTYLKAHTVAPETPFLILTGHANEEAAIGAVGRGAHDYFIKGQLDGASLVRAMRYAIEHGRREEMLRRNTAIVQMLQDMTVATNEADTLEQAMQFCLERICAFMRWPIGHAYVCAGSDKESLFCFDIWQLADEKRFRRFRQATEQLKPVSGSSLTAQVLSTGQAAWVKDVQKHPNFQRAKAAKEAGLRSAFAFPVLEAKKVVAILEFFSEHTAEADDAMLEAITHLSTQLGRVTERIQAQQALRESEQRFRDLIEGSIQGILIQRARKPLFANQSYAAILGYASPAEVLAMKSIDVFFAPHERPRVREYTKLRLEGGQAPTQYEYDAQRKDGSVVRLQNVVRVVSWEEEPAIQSTVIDITERKRAEDDLRKSQQSLAEAQRIAHIGSWERDIASGKLSWSDEVYRIFGLQPQQFRPTHEIFLNCVHPEDRERVEGALAAAVKNKQPYGIDYRVVRPDGEIRVVHAQAELLVDAAGEPLRMAGTVQDITESKRLEQALEARARQQAVIAELGQLALGGVGLAELLTESVNRIAETLNVEYCKLLELLPEGDALVLRAGVGWKTNMIGHATVDARASDSQAALTLHSNEPVIVTDLRTETRFSGPSLLKEHGAVSGMSVVIEGHAQPFGVLGVHTRERRDFARDDVNFLRAAANVLAGAIERKRAEEALSKRARRFEGVIRTSAKVAGAVEAEETLSSISKEAANLLGLEGAGFRLLEGDNLVVAERYGLAQAVMLKHSLKVGESLTGLVAREGRTIGVPDLRTDQRLHPEHKEVSIAQGIVAYLGTPLRYRGRLIGVLNVYSKSRHVFDDEEIHLLQAFADHAAITIEKARLYAQSKRHAKELRKEVAERKRAEEVLRQYEHIVSTTSDMMAFVDTAYTYRAVNTAYLETFKKTKEEITGHSVAEILGAEVFATRVKPHLDECLSGKHVNYQHWLDLPGQPSRYLDVHYDPFRAGDGSISGIVVGVRDITERRRAEEEIERLNEELEQRVLDRTAELEAANRELEGFSYSISHDLRAPLRHISGFIQLLQKHAIPLLDEQGQRYLNIISQSAERMGQLMDDLLNFSRAGRLEIHKSAVDLGKLVSEVLDELGAETKERDIDWKIGRLPVVHADRSMLRLVLLNLISNALKFTRGRERPCIEIGARTDGANSVVISVRDNGAGFDMKYVDKLFNVFQRLHNADQYEGTGIGLASVRRIIQRHGGQTWAEGQTGKGATFHFSLPRSEKGRRDEQAKTHIAGGGRREGHRADAHGTGGS